MSDDAVAPVLPVRVIAAAARFIGDSLPGLPRGTGEPASSPAAAARARPTLPAEFLAPSRLLGWHQPASSLQAVLAAPFASPPQAGLRYTGHAPGLPAIVASTKSSTPGSVSAVQWDPEPQRTESGNAPRGSTAWAAWSQLAGHGAHGIARVSDLGRLLVQMHHRLEAPSAEARPPDTRAPLVAESDGVPELAARLHESVSRTGLHYESHLAAWTRGAWPLDALRAEPQARWPRELAIGDEQVRAAGEVAEEAAADTAPPAERSFDQVRETRATPAEAMVRRQLDALERSEISWRGEVWSGRWVELSVREETRHGGAPNAATAGAWTARLRMETPDLGAVAATVSLVAGDGPGAPAGAAAFTLRTARADSGDRMAADAARLAGSLDARGLRLGSISVRHDPTV